MNTIPINKLKEYFENHPEVILVYLFGSSITGKQHPGSDVDIAVLFNQRPDFEKILKMQGDLEKIVIKDVDLVVLNDAPPVLRKQVLSKGREIFCRDNKTKYYFIIKTMNEYDDLKYYRKILERNIQEKPILA